MLKFKQDITSLTLIPAGGGKFEISINDKLIYSKLQTGAFPDPDKIVQDIRALR